MRPALDNSSIEPRNSISCGWLAVAFGKVPCRELFRSTSLCRPTFDIVFEGIACPTS